MMAAANKARDEKLGYFIPTRKEYCADVAYYNGQRTVYVHPVTIHDLLNENLTYYLQQAKTYIIRINTDRKSCSQSGHIEIRFDAVQDAEECLLQLDGTVNDFRATRSLSGCAKLEKILGDGTADDELFSRTVALSNLPESVTEESLYEKFPDAVQIVIPRYASDHPNERIRDELTGYALVTLTTPELALGLQNTKIDVGDGKRHSVHPLRDYPSQEETVEEIKKWVIDKRLKAPLEPNKRRRLRVLTGACGHYRRCKAVSENERKEFDEWAELMRHRLKEDQRRQREIETGVFFNREGECLPVDPNFLELDDVPMRPGFSGPNAGPMGSSGMNSAYSGGHGAGGYWEEDCYPPGPSTSKGQWYQRSLQGQSSRGPSEGPSYSTGNEPTLGVRASVTEKLEMIRGKVDAVDLLVGLTNLLSHEAASADSTQAGHGQRQPVKRLLDMPGPAGGKRWQGDDYEHGYGRGGYGGGYGHGYRGGYGGRRGGRGGYGYFC